MFKADSEKIFRPFITARADDMFSVTKAVRCQTDIFDSSIYKIHTENGNIRDAGRIVTNCENCGQLMITNRANASLTCGRTTCRKERLYKANDDYKKRAMKDPIKEAYLNFDNKCRSYRKKLSDSPELLEKYNKAFDGHRDKIRAVKRGLTVKSCSDDIDRYNRMCFDACQDLQDLAKQLKTLN